MDLNVVDHFLLPIRIMVSRTDKKIADSTTLTILKTAKQVLDYIENNPAACSARKFLEFLGTILTAFTQKADISRDASVISGYCDDVLDEYLKFASSCLHFLSLRNEPYLLVCFESNVDLALWAQFAFISKLVAEDEAKSVDLRCAALNVLSAFFNLLKRSPANDSLSADQCTTNGRDQMDTVAEELSDRLRKQSASLATCVFPGLTSAFLRILVRNELTNGRVLELALRANSALNVIVLNDADTDAELLSDAEPTLPTGSAAAAIRSASTGKRDTTWVENVQVRMSACLARLASTGFLVFNERVTVRHALLDFCLALLQNSAQTIGERCLEELFTLLLTLAQDENDSVAERARDSLACLCTSQRSVSLRAARTCVQVPLSDLLNRTLFVRFDQCVLRLVRVLHTEPSTVVKLRELRIITSLLHVLDVSGKLGLYLANERKATQLATTLREICKLDYSESVRLADTTPAPSAQGAQCQNHQFTCPLPPCCPLRFLLLDDARLVRQFDVLMGVLCANAAGACFALSAFSLDSQHVLSDAPFAWPPEQLHLLARTYSHFRTDTDGDWRLLATQLDESFERLLDVSRRVASQRVEARYALVAGAFVDALASAQRFLERDAYLSGSLATLLQFAHADHVLVSSSARAALLRVCQPCYCALPAAQRDELVERTLVNQNGDLLLNCVTVKLTLPDAFCDACFLLATVLHHAENAATLGVVGDLLAHLFAFLDSNYELQPGDAEPHDPADSVHPHLRPLRACLQVLTVFCRACAAFEAQRPPPAYLSNPNGLGQMVAELNKAHQEVQFAFDLCRNTSQKTAHAQTADSLPASDPQAPDAELDADEAEPPKAPVSAHIQLAVDILARSGALLVASSSLRLRVWLLENVRWACRALRFHQDELLPQTHRLWPTLSSCMLQLRPPASSRPALFASDELNPTLERRLNVAGSQEHADKTELLVAQHAFDTLAVLVDVTTDFVSGRIDKILNEALEFLRSTLRDDAHRSRARAPNARSAVVAPQSTSPCSSVLAHSEHAYYRFTREYALRRSIIAVLAPIYSNLKLKYPMRNSTVCSLLAYVFNQSTPDELRSAAADVCCAAAHIDSALVLFRLAEAANTSDVNQEKQSSVVATLSKITVPFAKPIVSSVLNNANVC